MDFNVTQKVEKRITGPVVITPDDLIRVLTGMDQGDVKAAIEAAKPAFIAHTEALQMEVQMAEALVVNDQQSLETAITAAKDIKTLVKALEEKQKAITGGIWALKSGIDGFVKRFKTLGNQALRQYTSKAGTYQAKIEAEAREREAKAKAEADKLQLEIDKRARSEGFAPPQVQHVEEKRDTVTRTESGASAHLRKTWTFEVEDLSMVSIEYLMIDTVKVNAAIKAGLRGLPGLRIFQKEDMVIR